MKVRIYKRTMTRPRRREADLPPDMEPKPQDRGELYVIDGGQPREYRAPKANVLGKRLDPFLRIRGGVA